MPYRAIFEGRPESEFGSPDDPMPKGYLALAYAGKEIWNKWRADYPTIHDPATNTWMRAVKWRRGAQNIQLASHPALDFAGFHFGDDADFSEQRFSNSRMMSFDNSQFGDYAKFEATVFPCGATFRVARFGTHANLTRLRFERVQRLPDEKLWVSFEGAHFGDHLDFGDVQLYWAHGAENMPEIDFSGCRIGSFARIRFAEMAPRIRSMNFNESEFGASTDFEGAYFGIYSFFQNCHFGAGVMPTNFKDAKMFHAFFERSCFGGPVDFEGEEFGETSFEGASFAGRVKYNNRKFRSNASFEGASFAEVPLFHNCELHQDTRFDEESFPRQASGRNEAVRAYRTLKLAMNKHLATREEQFFFRREMREERLELWRTGSRVKRLRSILYGFYEVLSDYGASVWRPTAWFLLFSVIAAGTYYLLSSPSAVWFPKRGIDGLQALRWLSYSLVNSLPLGGLDQASSELRNVLFAANSEASPWFSMILVLHKLVSLLFLFLIGVGLRNLFKMK
jgi:uncharacterized protein YjbI with pentapeptide repeats